MEIFAGHSLLIIVALVISVLTTLLGLLVTWNSSSWYNENHTRVIVGLGAGTLLAVLSLEFLPHAFEDGDVHEIGVFFVVGMLFHFLVDCWLTPHLGFLDKWLTGSSSHDQHCHQPQHEHHHHLGGHAACSVVGCLAICSFFDGFQLFSGFELGTETGLAIATGLFFHILPDGALAAGLFLATQKTRTPRRVIYVARISAIMVGGFLFLGTITGILIQQLIPLQPIIAAASGILTYVCLTHLLPSVAQSRPAQFALLISGSAVAAVLHFAGH